MHSARHKRLQIISGSYNQPLAQKVADLLHVPLSEPRLMRFANGEVKCQLADSVRGADVFVLQSHQHANDAVMEQAIIIDAARRASARHITAICPFMGYTRQDRISSAREPITAKLVVNIFQAAGADRLASIDLHSGQTQGFFDGPFDHLIAMPVLVEYIKKTFGTDVVIISPDAGRVKLAERYVSRLGADMAIIHKRRAKKGSAIEGLQLIGDVQGRHCVVIDDMIDGAGTVCAAAEQLKLRGAKQVSVVATHGLFSPPAAERLRNSAIDHLAVTDTLPLPPEITVPQVHVVSVASIIANAMEAIFKEQSVSALFNGDNHS